MSYDQFGNLDGSVIQYGYDVISGVFQSITSASGVWQYSYVPHPSLVAILKFSAATRPLNC
jgi:hypothetical protein